jgi:hypothetical protein
MMIRFGSPRAGIRRGKARKGPDVSPGMGRLVDESTFRQVRRGLLGTGKEAERGIDNVTMLDRRGF